jgi:hypothetical protein
MHNLTNSFMHRQTPVSPLQSVRNINKKNVWRHKDKKQVCVHMESKALKLRSAISAPTTGHCRH